jgi:hypothetical protein
MLAKLYTKVKRNQLFRRRNCPIWCYPIRAKSTRILRGLSQQSKSNKLSGGMIVFTPLLTAGSVPHHVDDPPAKAIIEQLNTIRAFFEWWSIRTPERVIEAHYVCEAAECFCLATRFPLPEILGRKYRIDTVNKIFGAQETQAGPFTRYGDYRHKASFRQEKGSEPVPLPRLAGGS